uniref:Uncharacterized protein n=1 Tax=Ditylenchus dipsaci TaxID=166011 RepID=A0A915CW23_9BILA
MTILSPCLALLAGAICYVSFAIRLNGLVTMDVRDRDVRYELLYSLIVSTADVFLNTLAGQERAQTRSMPNEIIHSVTGFFDQNMRESCAQPLRPWAQGSTGTDKDGVTWRRKDFSYQRCKDVREHEDYEQLSEETKKLVHRRFIYTRITEGICSFIRCLPCF